MQLFGVDIGTVIESLALPSSHDNFNHNESDSPLGGGDILCCGGSGVGGIRFPFNFAHEEESFETTMTMRQRHGGDKNDEALGRGDSRGGGRLRGLRGGGGSAGAASDAHGGSARKWKGRRHRQLGGPNDGNTARGVEAVDIVESEEAVETIAVPDVGGDADSPEKAASQASATEGGAGGNGNNSSNGGSQTDREQSKPEQSKQKGQEQPTTETQPQQPQQAPSQTPGKSPGQTMKQQQNPPKKQQQQQQAPKAKTSSTEDQPPQNNGHNEPTSQTQGQDISLTVNEKSNDPTLKVGITREEEELESPTPNPQPPQLGTSLMERDEDDAFLPDDNHDGTEDSNTKNDMQSLSSSVLEMSEEQVLGLPVASEQSLPQVEQSSLAESLTQQPPEQEVLHPPTISSQEDVLEQLEELEEEREEVQELEEEFQEEFGDNEGEEELKELKKLEEREKKLDEEEDELVEEIMEEEDVGTEEVLVTGAEQRPSEELAQSEPQQQPSEQLTPSKPQETESAEEILEEEMERFDKLEEEREELKELEEEFEEEFGNTDDETQLEQKAELEKEEKELEEEEDELMEEVMDEINMVDVVNNDSAPESASFGESPKAGVNAVQTTANADVVVETTGLEGSDLTAVTTLKDASDNPLVVEPEETSAMVTLGVPDEDDDDDDDRAWNDDKKTAQIEVEGAQASNDTPSSVQESVPVSNNVDNNIPTPEEQQELAVPSLDGGASTMQDSSTLASVQEEKAAKQESSSEEGNQETSLEENGGVMIEGSNKGADPTEEVIANGHKGTIPLSYTGEGSNVVHLDEPPVVGPVGSTATPNNTVDSVNNSSGALTDSDSAGGKESQPTQPVDEGAVNNNSKSGSFSFNNPECVDQVDYVYTGTSRARLLSRFLQNDVSINDVSANESGKSASGSAAVAEETPFEETSSPDKTLHCENIAKYHPKICLEQIFIEEVNSLGTADLSEPLSSESIASGSMNSPNEVSSGTNEVDDDDYVENDTQRHLYDYPEDAVSPVQSNNSEVEKGLDLVAANPSTDESYSTAADSGSSLVNPASESTIRKIVVTVGSHYCPESCNSVAQCEVARDHFSTLNTSTSEEAATEKDQDGNSIVATPVTDESTNVAGQVLQESSKGDSVDALHEGVDIPSTEGTYTKKATCKDDLTFLYQGQEGYDCNYIKTNNPDLCIRELDGDVLGIVYCPESCNLVDECVILQTAISKGNDGGSNPEFTGAEVKVTSEGEGSEEEVGQGNESAGFNEVKEGVASQATSEEGNEVTEMATDGDVSQHAGETSEGTNDGSTTTKPAPFSNTLCKDDSTFLYKGYEGYDCDYIKTNKPDKCLKEHNGEKVGIVSCPESCDMVNECMALQANSGNDISESEKNRSVPPGPDDLKTTSVQDPSSEVAEGENASITASPESGTNGPVEESETPSGTSCKDDPSFLYKGYAGFDCAYIKSTKPEKCLKEHNGMRVGIVSCPESCGMVDECVSLKGSDGITNSESGNTVDSSSSNPNPSASSEAGDYTPVGTETPDYSEVPGSSVVASNLTGDAADLNGAQPGEAQQSNTSGQSTEATETQGEVHSDGSSSGVFNSSLCKDDPNFLYKDKEGYTCHLIGTVKVDKCLKEHNGQKVGVVSCPESCNMVSECMANLNEGAATANISSNEGSDGISIDQGAGSAAEATPSEIVSSGISGVESSESSRQSEVPGMGKDELNVEQPDETTGSIDKIVDTSSMTTTQGAVLEAGETTKEMISQGPSGGESSELQYQGNMPGPDEDALNGQQLNGNAAPAAGESSDGLSVTPTKEFNAEGTKSMADEIEAIDQSVSNESELVDEDLGSTNSVQSGVNNTVENDDAFQNEFSNEIEKTGNQENMNYNYNYGGDYNDDATGYYDDDGVNSYENAKLDDMDKKDDDDDQSGEPSWESNEWGVTENEFSNNIDASLIDNAEGEMGENWNNPADIDFEKESWSNGELNAQGNQQIQANTWNDSSSSTIEDYTWDDDSGGMPTGLLALFFALVALFIYIKKKQNVQDDSRGGYQRVQPLDRGMYVSKKR